MMGCLSKSRVITIITLAGGIFELGDRVGYLGSAGRPKPELGARGTVVGVHEDSCEVLFDADFPGGTNLQGRWALIICLLPSRDSHLTERPGIGAMASAARMCRRSCCSTCRIPMLWQPRAARRPASLSRAMPPGPCRTARLRRRRAPSRRHQRVTAAEETGASLWGALIFIHGCWPQQEFFSCQTC